MRPVLKVMALAFILLSLPAFAAPPIDYCNNMGELACGDTGPTADDTGVVSPAVGYKISASIDQHDAETTTDFLQLLNNPDRNYFFEMSKSAFGFENEPQCRSAKQIDIDFCKTLLSVQLAHLAATKITSVAGFKIRSNGSADDLEWVYSHEFFKKIQNRLQTKIETDLNIKGTEAKLRDPIFNDVKKRVVAKINSLDIPDAKKLQLTGRIKSLNYLGSMGCKPRDVPFTLDASLSKNAHFDPDGNGMYYCPGLIATSDSEYTLYTIVAHELMHSIDPCLIQMGPLLYRDTYSKDVAEAEKQYPITNLISCMRHPKSIEAKINPEQTETFEEFLKLVNMEEENPTFCEGDQISETVADWMAAEVLASLIEEKIEEKKLSRSDARAAVMNSLRPACNFDGVVDKDKFDIHPTTEQRVDRIITQNQSLRDAMGCTDKDRKYAYCDGSNPDPKMTPPRGEKGDREGVTK